MTGRWADTPEPKVVYVAGANGAKVPVLTNSQELKPTVDVYPGETELLDVAVRVDGEVECYGWNDETFFYEKWRNPNLKFDKQIFLVEATITSSGKKRRDWFRVANDAAFQAFELQAPTPSERQAVEASRGW
jgi:hypothetical protein